LTFLAVASTSLPTDERHNPPEGRAKPVPNIPFTDLKIQSLQPGEFWDTKLASFGIRVGKNTKTFILKKDNRRIKLGRYPSITLQDARRKALTLKGSQLNGGTDLTLGEAIELFYRTHCHTYRPSSLYQTQHLLKKLEPLYGKKLGAVTTHDLFAIIDRQKRVAANLTFGAARTFFRFCARRRLIEKSPLQDLGKPHKTQSRSRILTDDELRAVWQAANQYGQFGVIVQLCALTGQRRGELSSVRPEWIVGNTLTIPASSTKNNRQHSIPCGKLTLELLSKCPFSFNSWSKNKASLDRMTRVTGWTIHDLRRTYATNMARLGVPVQVVEKLLNHTSGTHGGIVGVYQRYDYMPEMREAVERYEAHLAKLLKNVE
jgi:integrase